MSTDHPRQNVRRPRPAAHARTALRSHPGKDQRHLVAALAGTGQLRPDLDTGHAADIVYGVVNEDVYLLLTADCRWSRKRFQTWLAQTMLDQLITRPDPPHPARRRRRPS